MSEKVKKNDTVVVYATGRGKSLKQQGKAVKVHKIVADKLAAKGMVSFNKPSKSAPKDEPKA